MGAGGAEKLLLDALPMYKALGVDMELLLLNGQEQPFLSELTADNDIPVHVLSKGSVYNPLHVLRLFPYLKKFDLIHVHLFPALYWVAMAKWLSFSKSKLVYTEHNTSNKRRDSLFKFIDRFMYSAYTRIVTISSEVDKKLSLHLGKKQSEKFHLIANGIDLDKIHDAKPADREEFNISQSQKILLQVSSFTPQKDQATLIEVLPHLDSSVVLLLIGTGPLLEQNKDIASKLALGNRVQFLGSRMDVPRLLKMADAIILSSYYEGLSLSSIEGMASGRPFIASNVPGLTEIVKGAGLLFEQGNVEALALLLNKLLNDNLTQQKVAKACIERAAKFSIKKMIDKHLLLYQSICKNQN